jgi:hypothetical protein
MTLLKICNLFILSSALHRYQIPFKKYCLIQRVEHSICSNIENLVRWARSEITGIAVIECYGIGEALNLAILSKFRDGIDREEKYGIVIYFL